MRGGGGGLPWHSLGRWVADRREWRRGEGQKRFLNKGNNILLKGHDLFSLSMWKIIKCFKRRCFLFCVNLEESRNYQMQYSTTTVPKVNIHPFFLDSFVLAGFPGELIPVSSSRWASTPFHLCMDGWMDGWMAIRTTNYDLDHINVHLYWSWINKI